jgi:hypothetical protein
MSRGNPSPVPPELARELAALEAMGDEGIHTSDMPEVRDWRGAVRGGRGGTETREVRLRLDRDVADELETIGASLSTELRAFLAGRRGG